VFQWFCVERCSVMNMCNLLMENRGYFIFARAFFLCYSRTWARLRAYHEINKKARM